MPRSQAFRDRVPVLLCTESGGEGRNIQFCNTLINFDMPWNPMAIEQRIGRIDRIGQQREVFVFNLVTAAPWRMQVLRILEEKITMFELVVGEVGAILGGIDEERDFADLISMPGCRRPRRAAPRRSTHSGRRLSEARRGHETPRRSTRRCSARISRPREEARERVAAIRGRLAGAARRRWSKPSSRRGWRCSPAAGAGGAGPAGDRPAGLRRGIAARCEAGRAGGRTGSTAWAGCWGRGRVLAAGGSSRICRRSIRAGADGRACLAASRTPRGGWWACGRPGRATCC